MSKKYLNKTSKLRSITFVDGSAQFLMRGQSITTTKPVLKYQEGIIVTDVSPQRTRPAWKASERPSRRANRRPGRVGGPVPEEDRKEPVIETKPVMEVAPVEKKKPAAKKKLTETEKVENTVEDEAK